MLKTAVSPSKAEALAAAFHGIYEGLAPEFGYKTRPETAVSFDNIPSNNRALMIAVCKILIDNDVVRLDDCRRHYPTAEMVDSYWRQRADA